MKIKLLIAGLVLANSFAFAQTRFKKAPVTPNNGAKTEVPTLQKVNGLGGGVPLAQNVPFSVTMDNFKPMNLKERLAPMPFAQIMKDNEGNIIMLKGDLDQNKDKRDINQRVKGYLTAINPYLGLRDAAAEFKIKNVEIDETGITHARLQQVLNGAEVYGGEIILHGKNDKFDMMNGRFYPTPELQNTTASLSDREALLVIQNDLLAKGVSVEGLSRKLKFAGDNQSTLVIYHKNRDKNAEKLAWHWTVFPTNLNRFEYFVDAKTGEIIHSFAHTCDFAGPYHNHKEDGKCEELPPLDGPYTVNGALDLFSIGRTLNTHLVGTTYYLMDTKRSMFSAAKSKLPDDPVGAIWTLDAFNTSPENSSFKYDHVKSSNNSWSNKTAVSAHYNGGLAYDYYKNTHNREGINGKGGTIISLINIAEKNGGSMENAFWNGEAMFYGNGGSAFSPLARGLDVAGHEMSHGVIQETANLEYQGESGAMNESFADIFGAMIDRNDWLIGEDVVKTSVFPTGALRDLSNPNNGGKSTNDNGWQPKNVSEQYKGSQDNGGVHINSGITNFAYYKFCTATTKEKGEKVFYQALTKYLVKSSKFIDLRAAVVQSATDLYGASSNEVTQAKLAFDAVGIGGGGTTTGDNYQTNVNVNPGSDLVAYTDINYNGIYILDVAKKQTIKVFSSEINSRPSITDDGSAMVFVAADKKPYIIDFDWTKTNPASTANAISSSAVFKNVAVSKDGNLLAATFLPDDNKVTVFDFTKNPVTQKTFTLYNPTYSTGVTTSNVLYADALEFDFTGEYIMYDANNKINGQSGAIEYWDIGFMKVYDNKNKTFSNGSIEKLFSNLPELTSVGNPQFSKNSPYIMAFDYIDDYEKTNYAVSANLQTSKTGDILKNDDLAFPTFSRKDDKMVFEGVDNLGSYVGSIGLTTDKLASVANTLAYLNEDNPHWPVAFSNGVRKLNVGTKENVLDKVNIYPNPFDSNINIDANDVLDRQTIQVFDMLGQKQYSQQLFLGKNTLNLQSLPSGSYILRVGDASKKIVKM